MGLLPNWLARCINPIPFMVRDFLTEVASQTPVGSVVLDAGAGECQFADLFSHCRYISVDFAKGDSKWNYKHLSAVGDLLHLPLKNASIDAVICTQTIEHISEPTVLLNELCRVMKRGANLYLAAPLGFPIHQPPYDFFRYTNYGLEQLLRKSGFSIQSIRPQGGYFIYLGTCLQHMHRVLFPVGRPLLEKILFSPLQLLVASFASILGPLSLYFLDGLDKKRDFTLNYECVCRKE
jgi:SAM-dependent methyltransferase